VTVSGQFVLFTVIGGFAALVNVLARFLLNLVVPFEVAIVLAFPVALTFAFVLNRRFVFDGGQGHAVHQYARFWIVNLIALVQVLAVSVLLARVIFPAVGFEWHADTVAHIIGVLSPVLTSFLLHKTYTFGTGAPEPHAGAEASKEGQ
jgi:putative flippase GtrA